jgi:hypothetical protein
VHWTGDTGNTRKASTRTRDRKEAEQRAPIAIAKADEANSRLRKSGV